MVPRFPLAAVLAVAVVTAGPRAVALGERPATPPRIGVLFWHDSPNDREAFAGVRDGFALTGRDPVFEVIEARGDDTRARDALRDLDHRGVDLVYALGTGAALRARDTITRAPVVFTAVTDPVGSGVVADAAGSGGRLCGTASGVDPADVIAVFRRALPDLRRLGVIHDPDNPVPCAEVAALRAAGLATEPPLELVVVERPAATLGKPGTLETLAAGLTDRCEALWIPIDIAVYGRADEVARAAARSRTPVFATAPAASRTAAAVCVTVDLRALGRRSVVLAARVLDGADPGTLPVLRPRAYRTIVNLEAAQRTGFELPLDLLASADEFAGVAGGR